MLLAVIVRQKLKSHAAEVDASRDPRQKHKLNSVEKTRQQEKRPYTPPGQKSYGPLPKIPKISKSGTDLKTKSPVSSTATTSTVTLTTSPSTRGSSSTGDPIVEVYGAESDDGGGFMFSVWFHKKNLKLKFNLNSYSIQILANWIALTWKLKISRNLKGF